jgi:hypothetical protein
MGILPLPCMNAFAVATDDAERGVTGNGDDLAISEMEWIESEDGGPMARDTKILIDLIISLKFISVS